MLLFVVIYGYREFSEENILCWEACEKYRHVADPSDRHQSATRIISEYIREGAPREVNVTHDNRTTLLAKVSDDNGHVLDSSSFIDVQYVYKFYI